MKVNVLGKEYVHGTSHKTGKDFAANVVHISHKKNGVEGVCVESVWLDSDGYPLSDIRVGSVYDLDRDSRGFVIDFTLAR